MTEQQTHHDETIPPDLQATADLLRDALAAEPVPAAAQTPATASKRKLPIQFARFALPATAAAAILLMFGFVFGTMYSQRTQTPLAVGQRQTEVVPPRFTGSRVDLSSTGDVSPESDKETSLTELAPPSSPVVRREPLMRDESEEKLAQLPAAPAKVVCDELRATDAVNKQLQLNLKSARERLDRRNVEISQLRAGIATAREVGYNQDEIFRRARSRSGRLGRAMGGADRTPRPETKKTPGPSGYRRRSERLKLGYDWFGDVDYLEMSDRERPLTDPRSREGWNREGYDSLPENEFLASLENPLSTFSIDVDTASYANMRRFLNRGQLPPAGSIRIEELVNYFNYDYAPPAKGDDHPFAAHLAVADCPWAPNHRLVRVALKGKEIADADRPASNLVFLLDVSGSMSSANKLTLVKESMTMLAQRLDERDKVAIVVYAGAAGVVLPSTCASDRNAILGALSKLNAGGSTAGGAGIKLAYKIAAENFIKGGTNRVILCTDGDFNVGTTSEAGLEKLITEKAKSGVFLTVLGFGMGNYQDGRLEKLADKGNGAYGYIDNEKEARKHFVEGLTGTLITIAKDVKIQVEFNPAEVAAYRLIGYENRMLAKEDFNDDTKDAGEIGAGHTVTALYEIVPAGSVRNVANRIARLKERAAAMQKQIAEWTSQLPKLSDEKRNEQVQVIAEMVQMRGDLLAGIKAMETMQAKQASATPAKTGTVDPLKYITPTALSAEAKTGEMLTLKLRYKQPEGEKSILMQQSLTDKGVRFAQADREFQVAAMVAQFGMQLRGSKHAGNYSLAGVAETLAPLVKQYDPNGHRAELLNLVKKAATLKK